jgi:two-component system, OmpR family, osmolarity sensor histidine kinase EnvZ
MRPWLGRGLSGQSLSTTRAWSLVRRFTVLVLGVGVVSLAIQVLVLRLWVEPLFDDHVQTIATQVRSLHTALRLTPPAQRAALAQALSRGPLRLQPQQPDDWASPLSPGTPHPEVAPAPGPEMLPEPVPSSRFAIRLAQVLGAIRLHESPSGEELLFELPVDGANWWLVLQVPVAPQLLLNTALLWLGLLGAATLLATVLGLRWITRPLSALALQIMAQKGELRPLPADSQASHEIDALVSAFNNLVHANAMATSVRQQVLAGVSHDLRTPLARLRLRIETQCEGPVAEALEGDLVALQHIVDQFLAYVQGDGQARPGRERPVPESLAEVVADYRSHGASVELSPVVLPPGRPVPQLPELALRRMLENLISNALAHGQAPVQLGLREDGVGWTLSVADHGPGMSNGEFARARQPFVRLNEARNALGHCGLGLAIVDQIAAQWGGQLRVQPRQEGALFAVLVSWTEQASLKA